MAPQRRVRGLVVRRVFLFIFDLFLVAAATLSAVALRENFDVAPERWEGIALYTFITLIPAGMVLGLTGTYRSSWRHLSSLDYRSLINCAFAIVVSAQFAGFAINRLENVARTVPLLQLMLIPLFMIGARVLHKSYRASRRAMRTMLVDEPITPVEAVLIVGLNPIAELYVTSVRQFAAKRTLVAGLITDRVAAERGKFVYGLPVLGAIEDIGRAMRELRVHGVYVSRLVVTLDRRDLSGSRAAALETLAHSQSLPSSTFPISSASPRRLGSARHSTRPHERVRQRSGPCR